MRGAFEHKREGPSSHRCADGTEPTTRPPRGIAALPLAFRRRARFGRPTSGIPIAIGAVWPGDPRRGAALVTGEIEFQGELIRNPSPRWLPAAGEAWLAAWHGFDWISDLVAAGSVGRATARELVGSWLAEDFGRRSVAWRPDVTATRLNAWVAHFDEIAGAACPTNVQRALVASLGAHTHNLARAAPRELDGAARLRALKGLIAGTAALGGSPGRLRRALRSLERELTLQFLPDGGHRSRSPSVQLAALKDLVDIRGILRAADAASLPALQNAIERAAPVLRLYRHGDRRLALFNDSLEEDGLLIDLVLTRSEIKGSAPARAVTSGFERLEAGRSVVIVDTGQQPSTGFDERAHAGTLSFEMSHGRERLIVNCGAYRGPHGKWSRVTTASAAHSVLVVADTNSAEIGGNSAFHRKPTSVSCERAEHDGRHWISASHDGYRERFGLIYTRQLFLAADGDDLRGEERLQGRPGAQFTVRFHLHPSVEASLSEEQVAAVLRPPSGRLWRLRAAGAEMALGESVYLGSGEVRKTQQVVLSGTVAPGETIVRWALQREPGSSGSG
jgi:uncharacterized heparinase superfamily protein